MSDIAPLLCFAYFAITEIVDYGVYKKLVRGLAVNAEKLRKYTGSMLVCSVDSGANVSLDSAALYVIFFGDNIVDFAEIINLSCVYSKHGSDDVVNSRIPCGNANAHEQLINLCFCHFLHLKSLRFYVLWDVFLRPPSERL